MNKIRKHLFILGMLFSSINITSAQITFQKTYGGISAFGDHGYSVQQTMDGGYIFTGEANSFGAGNQDVYLIKTNSIGDTLWTKTFGGANAERGHSVEQTSDSGYIISGNTNSFSMGGVYLIKTNANGDSLWTKIFKEGIGNTGYSVHQTSDGGYVIAGATYNIGSITSDVYLIKTNANGSLLWSKNYGEAGNDVGNSIQLTSDGGYIITGYIESINGDDDVYLIKTDSTGSLLWSKTFGGTDSDEGNSVQQTTDGGYIIQGSTYSFGAGNRDIYLIKTDSIGNFLWSKTFGLTDYDDCNSVEQTSDGGYIIAGYVNNVAVGNTDVYLIKTNSIGDTLWTKAFGGSAYEDAYSVQQTLDGGYIICGSTNSFTNFSNVYLIKTDSLGNSGCNQSGTTIIVTSPPTQVTTPTTIVTSPATVVTTPPTIVGNGATVTTLCTSVGIAPYSLENVRLKFSPNPSSGNFIITLPHFINKGQVEIYNSVGEKIFTENILNTSQKEIHLKTPQGIYFVKVVDDEKQYNSKIVIE